MSPMRGLDELLDPCTILVDKLTHGSVVTPALRRGIMLHFDDSSSDESGVSWFRSPQFKLSYNRAYLDDGRRARLTQSITHAAWHAGVCKLEDGVLRAKLSSGYEYGSANTSYYGLCVVAGLRDFTHDLQFRSLVYDAAVICRYHGWTESDLDRVIVGHNEKAIFNPRDNPTRKDLWGKPGRKIDPIGSDPNHPVLSIVSTRFAVATLLDTPDHELWHRFS